MEFTEFRITNASVMFNKEQSASKFGCIGSLDESLKTKNITKKCEGIVTKNVVRPSGEGELKLSAHIEYEVFLTMFGMKDKDLKEGVNGYGKFPHESFVFSAEVYDEDDNRKLKAYPNCVISDGVTRKITNGADEVAEVELTLAVAADSNGYCMYEALDSELTDSNVKEKWLTGFTPELVKKVEI